MHVWIEITIQIDVGTAIKKPWRIVSWGVAFKDLHSKCDGSHTHGPCAGRETRLTQIIHRQDCSVFSSTSQESDDHQFGICQTVPSDRIS